MNMDVAFILKQIAYPIVTTLMLAICIPFVLTAGFLPLLGEWSLNYKWSCDFSNLNGCHMIASSANGLLLFLEIGRL